MREKLKMKIKTLAAILALSWLVSIVSAGTLYCQDDFSIGGFLDEDGDGFNDLLPDSDGDGVPDGLDPDSEISLSDSGYMHRYMNDHQEMHQMMGENMEGQMMGGYMEHGEPGMFGPGDSTMHGGHEGGGMGGSGGGGMGGSGGGMGPDSGGMGGPNSMGNQLTDPLNKEPILNSPKTIRPDQGLDKLSRGSSPGGE